MPKPKKAIRVAKPRNHKRIDADRIALLMAEIEDALGAAKTFGRSLELMGLGLRAIEDDYSGALVAVTVAVLGHLDNAKAICVAAVAELRA